MFMIGSKHVMAAYNINGLDYCFIRTITNISIHIISMNYFQQNWWIPKKYFIWVMIRNVGGITTILTLVFAMQYLPMGIYHLIYNTTPFWTSLLAYIVL